MGLFDFLKPKKNPLADLKESPFFRSMAVSVAVDQVKKQAADLVNSQRRQDAEKTVQQFLERYGEIHKNDSVSRKSLARISYFLTYLFWPKLVFEKWNEFFDSWNSVFPFPSYLAIAGASEQGMILGIDQVQEFKYYQGELDGDTEYYLVEFPVPPEQTEEPDIEQMLEEIKNGNLSAAENRPVLGPYYATVLRTKSTGNVCMYSLGQAPESGTTLRHVFNNGSGNCGPGPEPTPMGFLEAAINHLRGDGGEIAGVRFN